MGLEKYRVADFNYCKRSFYLYRLNYYSSFILCH